MKVYMKPIKMLCVVEENGVQNPIKFQIKNEGGELITIKIDNVSEVNQERLAGNKMFNYKCQSVIKGIERIFELKYEVDRCKWYLYKM